MMITRWHAQGVTDPNTDEPYTEQVRDEIMLAREAYRMKAKSLTDKEEYQRFSYPNSRDYIAFDPVTGDSTKDKPTGTMTIDMTAEVIKHLQKYGWLSQSWKRAYGQRSQVESSNKRFKEASGENLGDPNLRTGRGHTYSYLMCIIATVIGNVRRIITGIINTLTKGPTTRARRRRDTNGNRLARHTGAATVEASSDPPDTIRE